MQMDLHYTRTGPASAPVVLFLHGFMGSALDWEPVLAGLHVSVQAVAVDLPGHGRSARNAFRASWSMEATARALAAILERERTTRCSVVGYSMGGRVALYFALRFPERCERILLESASPGLATAAERQARRVLDEARARRLETGDFEAFLRDWYRMPLFETLHRRAGRVERIVARRMQNDPPALARSLREMGTGTQPSLWKRCTALHVPVLAVAGALDEKYVAVAHKMAALSTLVTAVVVPGAGHNVHVERPEAFLEVLASFLNPKPGADGNHRLEGSR